MGSIGHPCRTIQGPARCISLMTVQALRDVSICDEAKPTTLAALFKLLRGVFVFDQAVLLLPCWTNNHCPRSGLNVVIQTIGPPSHRLYRQGIFCHPYAICNRQNDKKKT